jgi:hypothetical protein
MRGVLWSLCHANISQFINVEINPSRRSRLFNAKQLC